jgi:hypothetical protein
VTGLQATNGRGVLWILVDLKPHLHTIFFSPGKHSFATESSVIVTSRQIIDEIIKDKPKH